MGLPSRPVNIPPDFAVPLTFINCTSLTIGNGFDGGDNTPCELVQFMLNSKARFTSFSLKLRNTICSTIPPLLCCDLKRTGAQLPASATQSRTSTFFIPPDVSLPMATPPWP